MPTPFENVPEAPYRFSKQRRRLSEGDSLSDVNDITEEENDEDMEISNLNEKMQGMLQATIQRNIFLRESFA